MSANTHSQRVLPARDHPETLRRYARRQRVDRLARWVMGIGGGLVILAVLLIFVYLLLVVLPFLYPAQVDEQRSLVGTASAPVQAAVIDEYATHAMLVTADGDASQVRLADGQVTALNWPLPEGVAVTAVSRAGAPNGVIAVGLADGRALLARVGFGVHFEGATRVVTPHISYPLGKEPLVVDPEGRPIEAIAAQGEGSEWLLVADLPAGAGAVLGVTRIESLLDGSVTQDVVRSAVSLPEYREPRLWLDPLRHNLYAMSDERTLLRVDLRDAAEPQTIETVRLAPPENSVTTIEMLAGGLSLLVGDDRGRITHWFTVRDAAQQHRLTAIRHFDLGPGRIEAIGPEPARRGFAALHRTPTAATLHLLHTTSERALLKLPVNAAAHPFLLFSAHADTLLHGHAAGIDVRQVSNPHPEISFRSLWLPVWYESRDAPGHTWQSSGATGDFEPKFSLVPLTFGTLKGAFYGMLIAVPLAVMGAIHTAYFMSPALRRTVKPAIELMAALPTVILGFLAGLWLAPLVEQNLPGVLSLALLLPLVVVLSAWLWSRIPQSTAARLPHSFEVLALIPILCLTVVTAVTLSPWLEITFFGGDMPGWLGRELGLGFDQRNSLVVGIAMGFAIIPIIFSIAEDAIFGVPRHLTLGSLALGATPWQTLTRVVLLTASPGIFSAVMIGFGRAVGETMIVLMATGNTPVMDWNIFNGFRALSANVAVEMPEAAVGSTHFRLLFLAALVLFVITFVFNTLAELVRSRLRARYGSL